MMWIGIALHALRPRYLPEEGSMNTTVSYCIRIMVQKRKDTVERHSVT